MWRNEIFLHFGLGGISNAAILVVVDVVGPVFIPRLQLEPIGVSERVVHHPWGQIASIDIRRHSVVIAGLIVGDMGSAIACLLSIRRSEWLAAFG